jgi:hypothetical protein
LSEILVVANRTLGGARLLESLRAHAAQGDVTFRLVVPATAPSAGLVIYDEFVREATQVRVDLAMSVMANEGIQASGEVGDEDPFLATMDAVAERRPDSIIVSTHPASASGWLRRDLIERIHNASGLAVEHVTVDLESDGLPFGVTLVIAAKTIAGDELFEHLRHKAQGDERHVFILVEPQQDGGGGAAAAARARLAAMLDRMHAAKLLSSGMIGDPDPYTACISALQLFRVDDVVISTLPDARSGWMRANLIERVKNATNLTVEHVVVDLSNARAAQPAPAA